MTETDGWLSQIASGPWHLHVWYETNKYTDYNGVHLDSYDNGTADVLVVSATPTVAILQAQAAFTESGACTFDQVELAEYTLKRTRLDFQSDEFHFEGTDVNGVHVGLVARAAYAVDDNLNGFDITNGESVVLGPESLRSVEDGPS